jgi:hypothetical protein
MTPNQLEIRQMLRGRVDVFVRNNSTAFRHALQRLTCSFPEHDQGNFMKVLNRYEEALHDPQFTQLSQGSPIEIMPTICMAPILITYFHLAIGTPLYLDEQILALWGASDGTALQCKRCGYRFPEPFPRCSLCGGTLGAAGVWELSRAAVLSN